MHHVAADALNDDRSLGNGYIEGKELDGFLREFVSSVNQTDCGPEVSIRTWKYEAKRLANFGSLSVSCDRERPFRAWTYENKRPGLNRRASEAKPNAVSSPGKKAKTHTLCIHKVAACLFGLLSLKLEKAKRSAFWGENKITWCWMDKNKKSNGSTSSNNIFPSRSFPTRCWQSWRSASSRPTTTTRTARSTSGRLVSRSQWGRNKGLVDSRARLLLLAVGSASSHGGELFAALSLWQPSRLERRVHESE